MKKRATLRPLVRPESADELEWEGVRLGELADRLGTPAFVFSERLLRRNCARFRELLPSAAFRYCVKSNQEIALLRVIAAEGFGALVSHDAELQLALESGFDPQSIAFQRPVLSHQESLSVLRQGVRTIHAHRAADIQLIQAAAEAAEAEVDVVVRVSHRSGVPLVGSASTRLGCTPEEVRDVASAIGRSERLRFSGLSVYVGTQQPDSRQFMDALKSLAALRRIAPAAGPFEINLGGGVPSAFTRRMSISGMLKRWRGENPGTVAADRVLETIDREWQRIAKDDLALRLVLEPGRALVADAGILLTRVAAVQRGWLFVDASRNYSGEMPLLFTRTLKAVRPRPGRRHRYDISGSTLNTADVVDLRRAFDGPVEEGDVLAFFGAGAYSVSRASRYGAVVPAVYLLEGGGGIRRIRRQETAADLAATMVDEPL